jgi:hypothetical protein
MNTVAILIVVGLVVVYNVFGAELYAGKYAVVRTVIQQSSRDWNVFETMLYVDLRVFWSLIVDVVLFNQIECTRRDFRDVPFV